MEFTDKIQEILNMKNITIKELCQNINLSTQTYYNWKKGTAVPLDKAIAIIKYLNISANELFEIKSNKTEKNYSVGEMYFKENEMKSLKLILDRLDDSLMSHLLKDDKTEIEFEDIVSDIKKVRTKLAWFEEYKERKAENFWSDSDDKIQNYAEQASALLEAIKEENRKEKELRKELEDV